MEQGVVMIPMYHSNGTHCGLARIRYMGNFALVDVRWSGRPRNNLELIVLTEDGPRSVRDGRVAINPNRRIYGIAALDSDGNCVCCGAVRGEERAFAQAMLLLRLGFPIRPPRPEPPRPEPPRPPRPEPPPGPRPPRPEPPRPPRPEPPRPRPPRPEPSPGPRPPRPRPPFGSPGRRMMADAEYFDAREVSEFLPSPAVNLDTAVERVSAATNNAADIQPFGPDVMPITSEQAEALLREGSQEDLSIPGMTEPIAPVRPQGYIYDSLTAEPAQLTMSTPAGAAEAIQPAPEMEARATFLERTAPPAQRTRPLKEQPAAPMPAPPARTPATPTAPGASGKFAPYTPPAPVPAPTRTPIAPAAPTAPGTSGKFAPYTPPAPARVPAPAPAAPKPSGKFAPYVPTAPTAPAAPAQPAPTAPARPAPVVPTAPIQPAPTAPPRPAPTAPTAPPRPAPAAPTAPARPAPIAPTAPARPAPAVPARPAPIAPVKVPCPGMGENIVQPADRCGENAPERQNACEPQQNICGQRTEGRRPRCDTTQDICRTHMPSTPCGECFAAVSWEDDGDAGIPANARPYVAPQLQQLPTAAQPGTGAMPQAPSMQPTVRPPIQTAQPGTAPQINMSAQPGMGTIPPLPSMQSGSNNVAVPQTPSMQPTVRPPLQATQPGTAPQANMSAQPGMGTIPPLPSMQPGNGMMPQAPFRQPTVRPPAQAAQPNAAMPQPGMGTMPMQPGMGTMPQVPSMQPTVRPPAQAAQPNAAMPLPGMGTMPMQPGMGTMPQTPSMQPTVRPPAQAAQPGTTPQANMGAQPGMGTIPAFPPMQPGMGTIPQIPSTPPAMIPPSPATQPEFGTPMQPNSGAGAVPQPPSTQPMPRPQQQGTGMQSGQGAMRPPTIQVPEIMQPMLPSDDDQTPTARQPGRGNQQQPMSPANSAALQQILQQASEIFPGQDMAGNAVPASAAAPQPTARVAQTSEDWQREVDALLRDNTPEAPSAEVAAPSPGGRRQSTANPFPGQFPDSEWVRIDPPNGEGYFYEGHMRRGNDRFCVTAVPGEYRPVPPRHLQGQGFGRYIPSRSGGCWVRIQKER